MLYAAMEVEYDSVFDDHNLSYFWGLWAVCWYNGLAKLKFVSYNNFLKRVDQNSWHAFVHIQTVWVIYYVQILMMFTMMLNFCVTVIEKAYQGIATYKQVHIYKNKALFNRDYYEIIKFFDPLSEYQAIVFTTEIDMNKNWENESQAQQDSIQLKLQEIQKDTKIEQTSLTNLEKAVHAMQEQHDQIQNEFENRAAAYWKSLREMQNQLRMFRLQEREFCMNIKRLFAGQITRLTENFDAGDPKMQRNTMNDKHKMPTLSMA